MIVEDEGSAVQGSGGMGDQQEDQQSTATKASAYVKPDGGVPTICSNCQHFDGKGSCDHPQVIADPEVQGNVDPNGHSKFFSSKQEEAAEGEQPSYQPGAEQLAAGARFRGPAGG